jgi:hypothetical protein
MNLFKTTEVMTVKDFINRNYHMDALGFVLGIILVISYPLFIISRFTNVSIIAMLMLLI